MPVSMKSKDVLLGKKPPLRHYNEIAAKVADFIDVAKVLKTLPDQPDYWGWAGKIKEPFPVFLNDRYGDCTCATQAQDELVQSSRVGIPEVPTDDAVFEMYHQTGIEQGLSDNDGRYHEGVLSYRKRVGLKQADGSYEKILGYAAVDYLNRDEVKAAGYLFGGLHLCVALPYAAAYQWDYGIAHNVRPKWNMNKNLPNGTKNPGSWTAGSWGGHAIYVPASVYNGLVIMTWGHRVFCSWPWLSHYADEMYAVVTSDWTQRTAPSGFDRDGLLALLSSL